MTLKPYFSLNDIVMLSMLAALLCMGDNGILEGINYLVMGTAIDAGAFLFRSRLENLLVGIFLGMLGNLTKVACSRWPCRPSSA